MKSILALLIMAFICTWPESASATVARPVDKTTEEIAGAALIGANIAIAVKIGRYLQRDRPGKTWGWIGVGGGVVGIALGATETTSFSGAVTVAGAVATVLGTIQLVRHSDTAEQRGSEDAHSHSLSFCPLVTSSEKSGCGIGILTRMAF